MRSVDTDGFVRARPPRSCCSLPHGWRTVTKTVQLVPVLWVRCAQPDTEHKISMHWGTCDCNSVEPWRSPPALRDSRVLACSRPLPHGDKRGIEGPEPTGRIVERRVSPIGWPDLLRSLRVPYTPLQEGPESRDSGPSPFPGRPSPRGVRKATVRGSLGGPRFIAEQHPGRYGTFGEVVPMESSARLTTQGGLLDDLDSVLWEYLPGESRFSFASKGAERLTGYARSRWQEEPGFWPSLLHAGDRERVLAARAESVRTRADSALDYRIVTAVLGRIADRPPEDRAGRRGGSRAGRGRGGAGARRAVCAGQRAHRILPG